jgi:hypothetical protein
MDEEVPPLELASLPEVSLSHIPPAASQMMAYVEVTTRAGWWAFPSEETGPAAAR